MKSSINKPTANPTGAIGHGYDSGSNGQVDATIPIGNGNGSNTDQSGEKYGVITLNPIGATGNGSNTNPSGQIDTTGHSNSNTANGQVSNRPNTNPATTNPTGATGHGSTNVYSGGTKENKPTINPDATGHSAEEKKEAITDLYMSNGNDYYIDDNAFSNAQMRTGNNKTADSVVGIDDNKTAASVAGSYSGESGSPETNSNVNTGVFGGPERAAHPGYSLW